ncbi:MAG: polyprenyl synthetase family protein [Alphaproteobacteria bacterium]|nr:polyprenyl synthetase family protein [Alphaproteobacteria bacterium]
MSNFKDQLKIARAAVDQNLEKWLPIPDNLSARVVEAMRYATIGGGKAFRAFLILTTAKMFDLPEQNAINIATAMEMVHAYSLIHDDLPAMDNDTMRRGKPTTHIQFDEATAILAGDALLTNAFEVLADEATNKDGSIRAKLVKMLAHLAGKDGMVGGQMIDLIGEKQTLNLEQIEMLQDKKTGALLMFASTASAVAAKATEEQLNALKTYAKCIGLMFQITDDILDVVGDSATVGKTLGKDKTETKSTFVSVLGLDAARKKAEDLGVEAEQALSIFGDKANALREAARFILERNY